MNSADVTPADEKAAADMIRQYWPSDEKMQALADSIEFHHHPNVFSRAFARHRIRTASLSLPSTEDIARAMPR